MFLRIGDARLLIKQHGDEGYGLIAQCLGQKDTQIADKIPAGDVVLTRRPAWFNCLHWICRKIASHSEHQAPLIAAQRDAYEKAARKLAPYALAEAPARAQFLLDQYYYRAECPAALRREKDNDPNRRRAARAVVHFVETALGGNRRAQPMLRLARERARRGERPVHPDAQQPMEAADPLPHAQVGPGDNGGRDLEEMIANGSSSPASVEWDQFLDSLTPESRRTGRAARRAHRAKRPPDRNREPYE